MSPHLSDLATIETWLMLQMGLEVLLVVLMIVFVIRSRRPRAGLEISPEVQAAMSRFLSESEKLSAGLGDTLKQKKELTVSLVLKLERKINELTRLLERAEESLSAAARTGMTTIDTEKANPAAPENRTLVLKLAEKGLSVEEIARRARLHRGEVELILDLEKQFNI